MFFTKTKGEDVKLVTVSGDHEQCVAQIVGDGFTGVHLSSQLIKSCT